MTMDDAVRNNHTQQLALIEISTDRELTRNDLPSEEQLSALFKEKGEHALFFYSFRCSLRALHFITAHYSIRNSWVSRQVHKITALVRGNIVFQSILYYPKRVLSVYPKNKLRGLEEALGQSFTAAAYAAIDSSINSAKMLSVKDGNSLIERALLSAKSATDAASFFLYSAHFAEEIEKDEESKLLDCFIDSCILDFNYLIEAERTDIEESDKYGLPLWSSQLEDIDNLQQKFCNELTLMGLDILAEDFIKVCKGVPISEDRLFLYFRKIGAEILSDDKSFRDYILGDDKAKENPVVRIMLVGPGGAGKSSLRDMIIARETEAVKKATTGIVCKEIKSDQISKVHGNALADIQYDGLELSLWDFGGQSIFHNLHRGFMRKENCVYVLVVDSRHEQAPDEWLAQIREHTREYAITQSAENECWDRTRGLQTVEVLLVTNCYEGVVQEQNRRRLVREYPDLLTEQSFYTFSCIEADEKFSAFLQALISACVDSQHLISESVFKAIADTRKEFGNDYFVKESKLRKKLGMQNNAEEWRRLLRKLEGLGHIVRNDKLNFCLNPDLVVNEAYKVINNDCIRHAGGLIDYVTLDEALEPISEEPDLLRIFLEEQMVMATFPLENRDYCLFPDAALQSEPAIVSELYQHYSDPVTIDYPLDTLPVSFKSHFVIRLLDKKENVLGFQIQLNDKCKHIWQDGLLIDMANSDCRILIEYQVARQRMSLKFYHGTLAEFNKPLRTLHDYIATLTRRDRDSLIPVLSGGVANLNHSDIKALFDGINVFKQLTEQGGNVVNNYNFENIQGSQIVTGDGSKAEAKHSFNANDPAQLKDLLLLALNAANKETDGANESLINEVKGAVEAGKDTLPEGSRFANTLLEKLPTWAQRVGDVQSLVNNIKDILDFSG